MGVKIGKHETIPKIKVIFLEKSLGDGIAQGTIYTNHFIFIRLQH